MYEWSMVITSILHEYSTIEFIDVILLTIISETNRCSLRLLRDFVDDAIATRGLEVSSQRISTPANEDNDVLIGSYVLFHCIDGYRNTDDNLNVTCNADGQWSTFPVCNSLTTARPSGNDDRCMKMKISMEEFRSMSFDQQCITESCQWIYIQCK